MKKPTPRKQASAARKNSTQTALANLEKSARKGDPKAKARLEKIYKLLHPGRSGRPEGSTTKHTVKGADSFENLLRADWGKGWDAPGEFCANHIWARRQTELGILWLRASGDTHPAVLVEEETLNESIVAAIVAAIDRLDFGFFNDMANALRRRNPDGTTKCDDPQAAALLGYVGFELARKPGRKFTYSDLSKDVYWGKDENGTSYAPTRTQLLRLITKFEIPK